MNRVALIAPTFHGYESKIKKEFEVNGFEVRLRFTEGRLESPALKKGSRSAWTRRMSRHSERILAELEDVRLTMVLVIRGEPMPPSFFAALRAGHPEARFVLYEWDAEKRIKYLPLTAYFDVVMSFERADCAAHGFTYLPLFHIAEYTAAPLPERNLDIAFIGGYHPDRDRIFQSLVNQARTLGLSYVIYEQIPLGLFAYLTFSRRQQILNRVRFRALSLRRCAELVRRARVVVDIEHAGQGGLTMRTFEALAAGTKLITTNRSILDEPFYSPSTIAVIDRDSPRLDPTFILTPNTSCNMRPYSLDRWVHAILRAAGIAAKEEE